MYVYQARVVSQNHKPTGLEEEHLQGLSGIAPRNQAQRNQWGGLVEGAGSVARSLGFGLSADVGFEVRKGSKDTILF